jgi:hypothetical protein
LQKTHSLETNHERCRPHAAEKTAIRTQLGAIFVSLELSRSTWLVTSLSPGGGEKMSKHSVRAGDVAGLLERFSSFTEKAYARARAWSIVSGPATPR